MKSRPLPLSVHGENVGESDSLNVAQLIDGDVDVFIGNAVLDVIDAGFHGDESLNERGKSKLIRVTRAL